MENDKKQTRNHKGTAKLRERPSKDRITLYLDVIYQKRRYQKNLELYIYPLLDIPNGITLADKQQLRKKNEQIEFDNEQTRLKANRKIDKIQYEINKGIYKFPSDEKANNFKSLFEIFVDTKRDSTQLAYKVVLNDVLKYSKDVLKIEDKDLSIDKINIQFLEGYITKLKEYVSVNTVRQRMAIMNIFFNYLIQISKIEINPFVKLPKHIKPKAEETVKNYLTISEIKQLLAVKDSIKSKYTNAFLFSCFTGLRFSDVLNLKSEDIRDGALHIRQIKSQNLNVIPLSKQAKQILNNIPKSNGYVFERFKSQNANMRLKKWAELANVNKDISFHSGRHSFATNFLSLGGNVWTLQKLLGHKDISMTMIYAKIIDSDKQKEIANFDNIGIEL